MGVLSQVERMSARNLGVDTWQNKGEYRVIQATGTKLLQEYIEGRQAEIAEWVAMQPVFEVCVKETDFEGGGEAREQWWWYTAVEWQLKITLE